MKSIERQPVTNEWLQKYKSEIAALRRMSPKPMVHTYGHLHQACTMATSTAPGNNPRYMSMKEYKVHKRKLDLDNCGMAVNIRVSDELLKDACIDFGEELKKIYEEKYDYSEANVPEAYNEHSPDRTILSLQSEVQVLSLSPTGDFARPTSAGHDRDGLRESFGLGSVLRA